MVTELKPPVGDSPGLLLFTHKERAYFEAPPAPLRERIEALADRYVFGLQWGRYHSGVGDIPYIDFQMACEGTVDFDPDADVRHLPMCSVNFTPERFRPMDVPETWDVLAVGHPIRVKRMSELLDVIRDCYDHGHELSVLLVAAIPDDPASLGPEWDHAFFEKYETLFSPEERANIHLAAPVEADVGNRPIHPIPNEVFPYLYNASRTFTLFSREEGQSKVVHEALLCGTPVVVHEDLKGGGRDHLTPENSRTFGTLEEAREAFLDLLAAPEHRAFDTAPLRAVLSEAVSGPRFEREVRAVYADLGEPFAGELDTTDLAFKLGGHTLTLPAHLRRDNTNDLRSRRAMVLWADRVLDTEATPRELLAARRADLAERDPTATVGRALKRVEDRTGLPLHRVARAAYHRVRGQSPQR